MAKKKAAKKSNDEAKICAALAYILVGVIWFFVDENMKKNKFVKFHVQQALVLLILSIAVNIVGGIIPFIGWLIILPIGNLLVFVLWVFGLYYALTEKEKMLPVIGKYGKKLKI